MSGNVRATFEAVTRALEEGAGVEQLATSMVMLAADRMARTPVGMSPGWGDLAWEMSLASAVRTVNRRAGAGAARRALYHAAWLFFDNRWLNIPQRPLEVETASGDGPAPGDEEAALERIVEADRVDPGAPHRTHDEGIPPGRPRRRPPPARAGPGDPKRRQRLEPAPHAAHRLRRVGALRPATRRGPQLLVGLSRWAADTRRSIGSQSAAATAQRFARGGDRRGAVRIGPGHSIPNGKGTMAPEPSSTDRPRGRRQTVVGGAVLTWLLAPGAAWADGLDSGDTGLDADLHRPRPVHDDPGAGPVLRRPRARQERPLRADAVLRPGRGGDAPVDRMGLQPGLRHHGDGRPGSPTPRPSSGASTRPSSGGSASTPSPARSPRRSSSPSR